jgi:hypothetical protein
MTTDILDMNTDISLDSNFTGADTGSDTVKDIFSNHIDNLLEGDERDALTEDEDKGELSKDEQTEVPKPTVDDTNSQGSQPNGAKQPEQQAQPPQEPKAGDPTYLRDGSVKLADGSLIKAGAERRLWEKGEEYRKANETISGQLNAAMDGIRRVQQEIIPQYENRIQQLSTAYNTLQQMANAGQQYGLQLPEQAEAMQYYAAYKQNPVGMVTFLLAQLKEAGHTIEGIGSGVDTMAVTRMLDQRLAPITQEHQQRQQQLEVQNKVANEYNAFISNFPDAKVHEPLIARMLAQSPSLSLNDAYYQLRLAVTQQGFDWSKPLGPQLQERNAPKQTVNQSAVPITQPTQPIPNGRSNAPMQDVGSRGGNGNDSIDDIIRQEMRNAGMKI